MHTVDRWFRFTPCQRLQINSESLLINVTSTLPLRPEADVNKPTNQHPIAFTALILLVWHEKEHLACKTWSGAVPALFSVCSEVQIITRMMLY